MVPYHAIIYFMYSRSCVIIKGISYILWELIFSVSQIMLHVPYLLQHRLYLLRHDGAHQQIDHRLGFQGNPITATSHQLPTCTT